MIRFACPGCPTTFTVEGERAGKAGKCPKCESQFIIPPAGGGVGGGSGPPPTPSQKPQPVEIRPCPTCQSRLSVLPADVDGDVICPGCEATFRAMRADAGRDDRGASPGLPDDRPRRKLRRWDDGAGDCPRSPGGSGYRCPSCRSTARPLEREEISTAGWVVFAVMITFCFPLFFIGLLMKERYRVCGDCGRRLR
jgi:ssDNA-binding Zn-finger/Zn-ribbon topoisomerase 1